MKTAAVVIDTWKLPIFKRHLDAAGYDYTQCLETLPRMWILYVSYEWAHKLQPVIEAANAECQHEPRLA